MANDAILKEISSKYRNAPDCDVKDILKWFSELNPNKAIAYWDKIRTEYDNDFPSLLKIRKFLSQHFKEDNENSIRIDIHESANLCGECGLIYANKRKRYDGCNYCPRCGSSYRTVVLNPEVSRIVFAQDWCWDCNDYRSGNSYRQYGPQCEEYGTGKRIEQCRDCSCYQCCISNSMRIEIPKETMEERIARENKRSWKDSLQERREFRSRMTGQKTVKEMASDLAGKKRMVDEDRNEISY